MTLNSMDGILKRYNIVFYALTAAFIAVVILRIVFANNEIIQSDSVMLLLDALKWILLIFGIVIGVVGDYFHYQKNPAEWLSKFKIMAITICGIVGVTTVVTLKYAFDNSIDIGDSALFWLCVACIVAGGVMWVLTSKKK